MAGPGLYANIAAKKARGMAIAKAMAKRKKKV